MLRGGVLIGLVLSSRVRVGEQACGQGEDSGRFYLLTGDGGRKAGMCAAEQETVRVGGFARYLCLTKRKISHLVSVPLPPLVCVCVSTQKTGAKLWVRKALGECTELPWELGLLNLVSTSAGPYNLVVIPNC